MWEDQSLADWPENDFRLFCGNLGQEVTDELLGTTFRKVFPTGFNMARVIRDKMTGKSKGYGFVSFSSQEAYIKAYRQFQGKHIGNRPVRLQPGKWKEKAMKGGKYEGRARFKRKKH